MQRALEGYEPCMLEGDIHLQAPQTTGDLSVSQVTQGGEKYRREDEQGQR